MSDRPPWCALTALPRVASASTVALRGAERLSSADFAAQVAAWRDVLAAQAGARWALHAEDT